MSFSIVVPAFNEHEELLRNIPKLSQRFPRSEILVIENGSNIAPDFGYLPNVRSFLSFDKGLGVALKFGIAMARTNYVVFLPADLSYDLSFVPESIKKLDEGYDIVLGSKGLKVSLVQRPSYRKVISRLYNIVMSFLYGLDVRDITGVKAYNKYSLFSLFFRCHQDGIGFEVELLHLIRESKLKVIEIPVKVSDFRPNLGRITQW